MNEYIKDIVTEMQTGERETVDPNVRLVSNCCGERTSEPDINGLAVCSDCKEGCVVEPAFDDWEDNLSDLE